nr:PREDICTED: suppressor APC domain-containing protein 2 [Anolis carolinensis]|eukprot:XP_008123014.1 PREDICTED: suppressor APC domain-containing protein 2 [Anolis carolinensis]
MSAKGRGVPGAVPLRSAERCDVRAAAHSSRGTVGPLMAPGEALPPAFLRSLRTLFDLLDERGRGFVHLREIESRWLLPGDGVREGLRGAASPDGTLTFERLLLGLRASLPAHRPTQGPNAPPLPSKQDVPRRTGRNRRHTITSGVDYGMLKQMKEMEKEKDFLLQGLEMVERVRDWYRQQIHLLQEQQKQLAQSQAHKECAGSEGGPGSLQRLLPKLQELNRCFGELLALSAKPPSTASVSTNGPACLTTASPPLAGPQQTINMLKEQNWLLTKEVTEKSDRITQLEQEKSALIKQLFEARAQSSSQEANLLDSTFI